MLGIFGMLNKVKNYETFQLFLLSKVSNIIQFKHNF